MNLERYEKIDGREALRRLVDGEEIFTGKGSKMRLDFENHQMVNGYGGVVSFYPLHAVLSGNWYIPKPFDVRQAMLDRPNEWVAAYNDHHGAWIQVGFDTVNMRPTKAYHGYTGGVEGANGDFPTGYELETCIPIEDVPEEATQ